MNSRLSCLTLAIFFCFLFFSCGSNEAIDENSKVRTICSNTVKNSKEEASAVMFDTEGSTEEADEYHQRENQRFAKEYQKLNNEIDIATTFTEEHDSSILKDWYYFLIPVGTSLNRGFIQDVTEMVSVDNLRQVDQVHYYTVLKIKDGGYLYIFFEKLGDSLRAHTSIYAERKLTKKDFGDIQVGDELSKVVAIDPTARCLRDCINEEIVIPHTKHLLTDGVLVIHYKKTDDDFIVTGMDYSESYVFAPDGGEFSWDETNFEILEKDFPR